MDFKGGCGFRITLHIGIYLPNKNRKKEKYSYIERKDKIYEKKKLYKKIRKIVFVVTLLGSLFGSPMQFRKIIIKKGKYKSKKPKP